MDMLQFYRYGEGKINDLIVRSPTLDEICNQEELNFFSVAAFICSIPTDYMAELDEKGIRYEDVDEYWFFLHSILPSLQSDIVHIILPNLHIESMILGASKDSDEEIVIDPDHSVTINKDTYVQLTQFLRTMFGFKYEPKIAQNELTRSKMIELAKRKKKKKKQNKDSSVLLPLISSMVNCADFKYSYSDVWDMPFFAFMDSVKRVNANRTSNQMCTGGYFGLKLSDVKDYTDWMRSL